MENLEIDSSEMVQKDTKEEKKWYVYMHTNLINGKKYIGITSKKPEYRWQHGNGYRGNEHFWRAIQKYGWDEGFTHEILFFNLSIEDAAKIEQELIKEYNTNDYNYGYNLTSGGDRKYNFSISEETRQKMIKSHSGENNKWIGRKHKPESKEKMSLAKIGKYNGINSWNSKAVFSPELNEMFFSQSEVKEKYDICSSHIGDCCSGKRNYSGKHPETGVQLSWLYVYDKTLKNGDIIKGAITLGYITEDEVNNYFNSLKEKGD